MRFRCLAIALVGVGCCTNAAAAILVFTEAGFGDSVTRRNTATDTQVNLIDHRNADPRAVAVDRVNRHIYYGYGTTTYSSTLAASFTKVTWTATDGPVPP